MSAEYTPASYAAMILAIARDEGLPPAVLDRLQRCGTDFVGMRDRALILLAASGLPAIELTALKCSDLRIGGDGFAFLTMAHSWGDATAVYHALLEWRDVRAQMVVSTDEPLFVASPGTRPAHLFTPITVPKIRALVGEAHRPRVNRFAARLSSCGTDLAGLRDRALVLLAADPELAFSVEQIAGLQRAALEYQERGRMIALLADHRGIRQHYALKHPPGAALDAWVRATEGGTAAQPLFPVIDSHGVRPDSLTISEVRAILGKGLVTPHMAAQRTKKKLDALVLLADTDGHPALVAALAGLANAVDDTETVVLLDMAREELHRFQHARGLAHRLGAPREQTRDRLTQSVDLLQLALKVIKRQQRVEDDAREVLGEEVSHG